jgi:ABC-type multidrug transport system ATPase subunit
MTLLLGSPGSGKTTLLLALAGKLDKTLKVVTHFTSMHALFLLLELIGSMPLEFSPLQKLKL